MSIIKRFYSLKTANEFKKLFKTLLSAADEQGWKVKALDSGHYQFLPPDKSKGLVTVSGTPSDHRAWANIKSDLIKRGFNWPWAKHDEQPEDHDQDKMIDFVEPKKEFNVPDYGMKQEEDRAKKEIQEINKLLNTEDMSNEENVKLLNETFD
jgi:hypothetical protein